MTAERNGNPKCNHVWIYDDAIIATNPPIVHRICSRCGRVEHSRGELSTEATFNELYKQFESKS